MPPQRTRTRSWPGPISGVGTSSTRRSPGAWMTRASMFRFRSKSKRGGDAAIDIEDVAVDEVGRIAGKKHRGAHEVLDVAPAARRRAAHQPPGELLVLDQRLGQLGLEVARPPAVELEALGA